MIPLVYTHEHMVNVFVFGRHELLPSLCGGEVPDNPSLDGVLGNRLRRLQKPTMQASNKAQQMGTILFQYPMMSAGFHQLGVTRR